MSVEFIKIQIFVHIVRSFYYKSENYISNTKIVYLFIFVLHILIAMGQFKALTSKNWTLYKRSCCGNIVQIVVPILFVFMIVLIRRLVTKEEYAQQSFLSNSTYTKQFIGIPSVAALAGGSSHLKNCLPGTVVGLAPSGMGIVTSMSSILTTAGFTTVLLSSDSQIDSRVRNIQYGNSIPKFCFAITFDEATAGGNYRYNLRFNVTSNALNTQGPSTTDSLMKDTALDLSLYKKTLKSGMIGTNTFVNNMILQAQTGLTTDVFQNTEGPIYQQAYILDSIYTSAKSNIAIMFLLPLLIVYLRQTSTMLYQKQHKIRESMSIMGMSLFTYNFTWFIRYFIVYLVIHIISSAIVSRTLTYVPFYISFVVFIIFDIVLIIQSFFIQVFFTRARIGVVIALLFFIIQYIISFIVSNSDNPTQAVNNAASIIPHIGLILAFQTMLYAQSVQIKLTFSEVLNNYSVGTAIGFFFLNIVFWLFLYWYLEQVFPNEFGAKKHPLFCCFDNKKNKIQDKDDEKMLSDLSVNLKPITQPDIQQVDQRFKLMESQNKIIDLQNLRKQYNEDLIAVNDLTVKMYNDQIFVLLGHNGAGKTTTISMLTGMIQPTSGTINVLGQTELQKIRQKIGICPQHDTLYEQLTVQQHLELFATFKGLQGIQLQTQITKLITDVNLGQKRDEYAKNLSGGQKRRLSVAMAFAGRSKVIILDEPTSGMDTSARRYIWELLKNYKNDRIILLTTHFMDEADYLGDRIGIMAGGKLVCCGSGFYLKNKFGVGYNITLVKQNTLIKSQNIINLVQRHIDRAQVISNVSSQIQIQLPLDTIQHFSSMFNELDAKKQQLGISTYGISITTLQEVFLKVGDDSTSVQNLKIESNTFLKQKKGQKQLQLQQKQAVKLQNNSSQVTINEDEYIQKLQGRFEIFILHLGATILKRLRVIKKDYKSFVLELVLPMIIIILALLLMRISFIKDLPAQTISLNTYLSQSSPLTIPIGSSDTTLRNNMETLLTTKYGSLISVNKDTTDLTDSTFDLNYLFPRKESLKFLPGGIKFEPTFTNGSVTPNNIYPFTSIVNTKIPTSIFFLQNLAAETYINHLQGSDITITMVNKPFLRTYNQLQINNTISGFFASLIFSLALAFKFASIISFIVKQRADRSKHQQIVSGMNIYAYWFGNFIYDYLLYLILAVFSVLMCKALSVDAFTGTSYGATWIVFLLYGLAYIPFTYIAAYIFIDYGNALAGFYFFTFVIGGLLSTIIMVLRFLGTTTGSIAKGVSWILRLIPCYSFGQALVNLGSINLLSTAQLSNNQKYGAYNLVITLAPIIYLIVEFFAYTILVFVIQFAFNNENFMRFWTSQNKIEETEAIIDNDVLNQQQKALKADPQQYQILTKKLRKVYMVDSVKKHKVAVDNLSFGIQKGQVFGLLGVNGAGKTTTFKMLAGQITSTSGDSYFNGVKISENLSKVRQNLGYCPQFDALIQNLTVREQIQLFYDLKSLKSAHKDQIITNKIKELNLEEYQNKLSGTLSGGNKRKLSVAMAMIGNPSIIFLDQPSTGMDPKARRFMWKIISRIASQKKKSTIILTTHSMEQAQALSTRLGIMVKGNFKCIGTPQHIKSKFGDGYEIQVKIISPSKDQVKKMIQKQKLENKLVIEEHELQGLLSYLKVQPQIKTQISQHGSGGYIYNQLKANQKIQLFPIIEFIQLEQKSNKIRLWMKQRIGSNQIIENFQTFIRFKVSSSISVGKMFQEFETNKVKLQIQNYSIKQATVQQIFNKFAEDGELSVLMG